MRSYVSRVAASGHAVVVRVPDGARFLGRYRDDESVRDLTGFVANLLLTGALDALEVDQSARPEPAESVAVVDASYLEEPPGLGAVREVASFTWVHLPSGEAGDFPVGDVLDLITRGLGVELTAAVATEAVEVPEDAGQLGNQTADGAGDQTGDQPGEDR